MNGEIEIIGGNLGGGKSYLATELTLGHLGRGGAVWSNVEMFPDRIEGFFERRGRRWPRTRLHPLEGDLSLFHKQLSRGTAEMPAMCVVDESHLTFNARDWVKTDRGLLNFATLVRKLDIKLIFITQAETNLDKQFRLLANRFWHCRNLSHYKILGVLPCPIPLMFRTCYANAHGKLQREYSDVAFRKSEICGCYKSDALLGAAAQQFASMNVADWGKLEHIPRPIDQRKGSLWPSFGAASAVLLWALLSGL